MKIGVVPYLNALPLYRYLPYPVTYGTPAQLEAQMKAGELDLALLPIFSFLNSPYLPLLEHGVIQSQGPVESVLLFHRKELNDLSLIKSIKLTEESRTSVALFKVIYSYCWKRSLTNLQFNTHQPDAFLEIGDKALFFENPDYTRVDLGQVWQDWTGLPFVYAGWVSRKPLDPKVAQALSKARDEGRLRVREIVATLRDLPMARLEHYLTSSIKYEMVPRSLKGIQQYQHYCFELGLLKEKRPIH